MKAAEQGFAFAQSKVGISYYFGKGVEQNYTKVFEWFEKAAKQGNVKVQFNLGVMYDKGEGVAQNKSKAF